MSKELLQIPGVGKSIRGDLEELGFETISSLIGADPQEMYDRHCKIKGMKVDRCVLHVFRCPVYFATEDNPDPEKLKWWKWKD